MTSISHHIPEPMLAAYAAGTLPHAFSVVVATHISMCSECRAVVEAHEAVGGIVLDDMLRADVSSSMKSNVLAMLDDPFQDTPVYQRRGPYPGPVMEALKGQEPRWKKLGMGVRQDILSEDKHGSVRLLYIPPGQAVPDHGHNGLELTLVLQGSFSDETGQFGVGDVEVADETLEHTPIAGMEDVCICLAATDARLRFNAFVPRLLQPIFRI
ncbi:ChrR family anti-sigma-E factor [Shimia marina]|uniref:Transcriptional activator ChrR n=1 Tax=Shimia marina TaxID=321267 RepID=A0A0P1EUY6_9RHOB|nr:ChrR family anti-sigma-E factor [Shimia marina]CUH54219.1 Transcriptional activator ChrR [Shimia marina]SFD97926.1 anti-ECFsigma factor, ChrR [Shimia marina]